MILSKLRPVYVWLSYYKYDFRLCDSWKIRFQTRQFGNQWSCQTLVECNWVTSVQRCQQVSTETASRKNGAHSVVYSVPIDDRRCWGHTCPVKFKTPGQDTWAKIWLVWWQSLLISVGWSIINTSRTIFMLLVLWFGVFFIEKSSRESVEAISCLAVFDRFYQDSGRKSACVNDVQSPRAA